MADDLTLIVNNQSISGWESIRVTRGIEQCPSSFDISLTESFPGEVAEVVVSPGDPCRVLIGSDLVITGYVDRYHPSITSNSHTIRITGRGRCQDLVDCAAEWPGCAIMGSSALEIAQKLALPYGITVSATQVDVGPAIPMMILNQGETPYELIERVCRFRGLLAYELPDGGLFLTQTGTVSAASGFTEGQNVQAASIQYSMDQRFSEYLALRMAVDNLGDTGNTDAGGNILAPPVVDAGVPRHRRMVIIAQSGGMDVCVRTAIWEMNRRAGRSNALTLTTDSWRDADGVLWTPNTLVLLVLPHLKLQQATWLIGSVTYNLDENGTTAELTIMPPGAFLPQPILLLPDYSDVHP